MNPKRLFEAATSFLGLQLVGPFLLVLMFVIWLQDFHSPLYTPLRVGRHGKLFRMIKLRTMAVDADKSGVDSTASDDRRITRVGAVIRRYKLDEVCQLFNVILGQMSFVGPRPNVRSDVDTYTSEELTLLTVRPGITDFASIVFADEGEILTGSDAPDLAYSQLIRPWKSRLGLFYVNNGNVWLDLRVIWLTMVGIVSRQKALEGVVELLQRLGADASLVQVARRETPLRPVPPPGMKYVIGLKRPREEPEILNRK